MARILIVDDEPTVLSVLARVFRKRSGHEVVEVSSGQEAIDLIRQHDFDILLTDVRMSPIDGLTLLKTVRQERPSVAVVLITAYSSVPVVAEAQKLGAFDCLAKPFKVDDLLLTVERAIAYRTTETQGLDPKVKLDAACQIGRVAGNSAASRELCDMIQRVAPTHAPVLIEGPPGAEADFVAEAIHGASPRRGAPYVALNASEMSGDILERHLFGGPEWAQGGDGASVPVLVSAEGGTLFLDRAEALSIDVQRRLGKALMRKSLERGGGREAVAVDVRLIVGIGGNASELMARGLFAPELLDLVRGLSLKIAPLAARQEDILLLAQQALCQLTPEGVMPPALPADVCAVLKAYAWPGNAVELRHVVKVAISNAKDDQIDMDCLPPELKVVVPETVAGDAVAPKASGYQGLHIREYLVEREKDLIREVIEHNDGDRAAAARLLNMTLADLTKVLDG